ncbi:MAG: type II secretion system GspH family protein [Clostridia bacterium]|nr:type II secretion system GspH family protein [Clostridia bacterium]
MSKFLHINKKSGFTLAELCVVMAIAAIVGTMVVTFMIYASGQQAKIAKEAKCISEITKVQKNVNAWIKKYDSENYTITSPGNNKLIAKTSTGTQAGVISFNNKKITVDNRAATEEFENISSIAFFVLDGKNALKVTIRYEKNETQDLFFSMFSKITRNRRVENRS